MRADNEGIPVDVIAGMVHNAQRELQYWLGDPYPSAVYSALPEEGKAGVQSLVRLIAGGYPQDYAHEMWVVSMTAKGWVYGEVKDPEKKTHPCMVPHRNLPLWEKRKLNLAYDIVNGFVRYMDLS